MAQRYVSQKCGYCGFSKWSDRPCPQCGAGYEPPAPKQGGYANERVTRDGRPVEAGRCTECERPHDDRKAVDEATNRMCNDAANVKDVNGTTAGMEPNTPWFTYIVDRGLKPAYGTSPASIFLDQVNAENTTKKVAAERKATPVFSGVLAYFPDAIRAVARLSQIGNDQHNPGQPLHWAREKSNDHADCIVRHQLEVGTRDTDGVRHATKVAWRALAQLQLEIEADQ